MAYGQTGSGKTYTMLGPEYTPSGTSPDKGMEGGFDDGIIPRAGRELFRYGIFSCFIALDCNLYPPHSSTTILHRQKKIKTLVDGERSSVEGCYIFCCHVCCSSALLRMYANVGVLKPCSCVNSITVFLKFTSQSDAVSLILTC